jgi:hypothetical protein
MPRIVTGRIGLTPAQLRVLEQIDRAEPLLRRHHPTLRSLEARFILKLRRPGFEVYPADAAEYVITDKGRSQLKGALA